MQYQVIIKMKPTANREQLGALLKDEAQKVWELQTSGALRSIHFIRGNAGVALMLEAADDDAAERLVQSLPMVAQGLLSTETIALVPFTGLAILFAGPTAAPTPSTQESDHT